MNRLVPVLIATISLIAGAAAPVQPALADNLSNAQTSQAQLNAKIAEDKQKLAQVLGQEAETQARLNLLSDQISLAQSNLTAQKTKLDTILGQIDQAQRDLAAKKAEEARRQNLLNHRMRGLYKQDGNTNFLDAIFGARSFSELVDRFMVMRDITPSDELLLHQIHPDPAAIEPLNLDLSP